MNKVYWRVINRFERYFRNDRFWSIMRFLLILTLTFIFIRWGFILFETVDTSAIEETVQERTYLFIPNEMVVRWYRYSQIIIFGFRHAIIPVSMFIGVLLVSAFYVQDVYELSSFGAAFRHIFASFVGFAYPRVTVKDGAYQVKKGDSNLIETIGGPGYVNINPNSVILVESLRSAAKVLPSGYYFLSRFDTVRELVHLDDQHGFIEKLRAVRTKDGIQIEVRDMHYRYRLRTGKRFGDYEKRTAQDPYPFSVKAVQDMSYNRAAQAAGQTTWHAAIRLAVDGAVTDYIKEHNFDQLTAPGQGEDPRAEISQRMMSGGVRTRLRNWGAELVWFDVGHFDVVDEIVDDEQIVRMKKTIEKQRIDTWSARWDGNAMIILADGEGQRMAAQDVGRAEGQAEMLMSIMQALEEVELGLDGERDEGRAEMLRGIIWTRVAQVLDRIADEERKASR